MATKILKTNYVVEKQFEAFFTGGAVATNGNGSWIFTTCGNVVNILDVSTGAQIAKVGSPDSDDDITCFTVRPVDDSIIVAYKNLLLKHYSVAVESLTVGKTNSNDALPEKPHVRTNRIWKSNHRGPIIRMAFSQSGRLLATGGSDSVVKIWDLELQYCVFTLRGAIGIISCMFFEPGSNDGTILNRFYYGGDDGKVLCWDLKENRLLATFDLHTSAVTSVAADRGSIYTAGRDSVVGVWDRQTLTLKKTLPVFDNLETLVVTSNNGVTVLISGGEKGIVKMWDPDRGVCAKLSSSFGSCIKAMFLCGTDQQKCIVVATEDHVIYFLKPSDLSTSKHLIGYNDEILDAAFLRGDHVAVASNSKDIRVYNVVTGDCRLVTGHTDIVMSVDTSNWCPSLFASGSKDNCVKIWQVSDQNVGCVAYATGHTNTVTGVRFARTKPHFVCSVSDDTTMKIWRLPEGIVHGQGAEKIESQDPERMTSAFTVAGHDKDVTCIDVSPNDRLIATGSMDKTVKIWQVNLKALSASLVGTITGHKRGVWDVCFSPKDQVLATASGDWTVKIFSLEDFSCVKTFQGHPTTAVRVRFLPSGVQLLSSDSSGLLKLWNIKSGECTKTFDAHSKTLWALELNEDGSKLLSGGADSKLQLWKDVTEEELELEHTKQAQTVADEQMLANLVEQKKFAKALKLAIRLSRPFNAFKIMKDMIQREQEQELAAALRLVDFEYVGLLLDWICEWNTNSRNCHVAQRVLAILFRQHAPERLLKLANIKSAIEALIPYSERHFERYGRLRQQAAFAQYSWQCLRLTGRGDDNEIDKAIKDEVLRE